MEYNPKMKIIVDLIHTLYKLPDCGTGGCCHIVTDDGNIRDNDLKWVMEYCHSPENNSRIDRELSYTICELLLQLSYEQRAYLFNMMNYGLIDNGIDEERWDTFFK
jgi:hypothetical protein